MDIKIIFLSFLYLIKTLALRLPSKLKFFFLWSIDMELEKQGLQLISISDILKEKFFIPSYQRGYRWEKSQIISLLDDIFEFIKKDNKTPGEFYCLQPIVITRKNNNWCVIDGQQRLTTIFIILKFLEDAKNILFPNSKLFSLSYETRKESEKFLNKINETKEVDNNNADFYCMSKAYLTIKEWFEEKEKEQKINRGDFLNALIKVDYQNNSVIDNANNVRFIWYYVAPDEKNKDSDRQLFKKINMGRIPLTNAELIKALFLTSTIKVEEKEKWQNNISYEWNEIEDTLQDDEFWHFLNQRNNDKITRIDFIFDLLAKIKNNDASSIEKNDYYTFNFFNNLIKDEKKSIKDLWDEVKKIFRTPKEWFSDNTYHHLIGYLIHSGKLIADIFKLSINSKKSDFKGKLKQKIKDTLEMKEKERIKLDDLSYNDDKEKIKNVLLLFNILSTMNSKNSYFSFQKYDDEKWSLEHIHAQNSKSLNTDEQRRKVLEEQKDYYSDLNRNEITSEIDKLLEQKEIEKNSFDQLQTKIDDDGNNNLIHNLALLSSKDNSALSNYTFKEKRQKIILLDSEGRFIPLCTKNVFLKYYSKETTQNEKWTQKDGKEYIKTMEETINSFIFSEEKNGRKN